MNTIHLDNTLPNVFLSKSDLQSDIWRQQVCFEKGKTYLIEAGSGTGKSSLCSFVIGCRRDFDGKILFDGMDSRRLGTKDWSKLLIGWMTEGWFVPVTITINMVRCMREQSLTQRARK